MDLDITDMRLLYCLSLNARLSYTVLASNLRVSREAVKNRLERLTKKGILNGTFPVLNHPYFGLKFYHLYLSFHRIDATKAKKLDEYIKAQDDAIWKNKCLGRWDYALLLIVKDSQDLSDSITRIKQKLGNSLKDLEFEEILYEYRYTALLQEFFKKTKTKKPLVKKDGSSFFSSLDKEMTGIGKEFEKISLDKEDVKIMELLSSNARMPLQEISANTGMPLENIRYRLKRMVEKKAIAAFWPGINYGLFGFNWYRIRIQTNSIEPEKEKELIKFIVNHPKIFWSSRILGKTDLHIDLRARGNTELNDFLQELNEKFSEILADYETLIMTEEPNYNNFTKKIYKIAEA